MALVLDGATRRHEIRGPAEADIGLGRIHVARVGGGLGTGCADDDGAANGLRMTGFGQELLDDPLGLVVIAFAEMMVPNPPGRIDAAGGGKPLAVSEE